MRQRWWDSADGLFFWTIVHTGSWGRLISECPGFLCDSNLVVFAFSSCSTSFPLPVSWVVTSTPIWLLGITQEISCSLETIFLGEKCSESPECLWSLWVSLGPWILSTLKVKPLTSKTENLCVLSVRSCCLGTAICSDPVLLVRGVMMYETDVKQARSILPQELFFVFFDTWCTLQVANTLESPELREGKMNETAGGRAVCDYHQTSGLMHFSGQCSLRKHLCLSDPSQIDASDDGVPGLCGVLVCDVQW